MKLPMMRPRMSVARRSFFRATRFRSRSLSSGVEGTAAAPAPDPDAAAPDLLWFWLLRPPPHLNPFSFEGEVAPPWKLKTGKLVKLTEKLYRVTNQVVQNLPLTLM